MSVSDGDAELNGEVKALKMHVKAARAIPYRSSCVVIWHIIPTLLVTNILIGPMLPDGGSASSIWKHLGGLKKAV